MAQASKAKRRLRRLKRERTLAFRMTDIALKQRDQARIIAGALNEELKKHDPEVKPEPPPENSGYGKVAGQLGLGTEGPTMVIDGEIKDPIPNPSEPVAEAVKVD